MATLFGYHGNVPCQIGKQDPVLSSAHKALSYGVKIVKIGPVDREIFDKYASILAMSYQTFTNELCQLWSYWTEFHEIFTQYAGIICAVNLHIEVAIFHSVSECQMTKVGSLPFCQNRLPWQRPLRYRKNKSRSIMRTQYAFIRWKDCENRSSGSWDSLREIIKKEDKKINASKIYSQVGNLAELAK